ncbi:ER membrane complex subunit 3 [Tulasnella sp. 330]|nr:ER membrane complex subunit 3 [Tulasnella sp. 330]KAG8886527.1 ER membrane complex subunit 3 [Tulasnella sp. 331]KAG8889784.1 ER membrane complex subunit 3 [Tulasnella sp. 332]
MVASLYLDPQIRDWVLFPITFVMILVGLLRHYVTLLLQSQPKKQPAPVIREQRALLRAQILRQSSRHSPLPPAYYRTISSSLSTGFTNGVYLKDGPRDPNAPAQSPMNALSDPSAMEGMMEGMKKQMVMNIPQMVIMGWISFFFHGFIILRLPFPLTRGFKPMLQRGIETPDMDVRWVSSLSWYFLNLFGLNGLFSLILGGENSAADKSQDPASSPFGQASNAMQTMAPGQDMHKIFLQEKENLELADGLYKWAAEGVEQRMLERWARSKGKSTARTDGKLKTS